MANDTHTDDTPRPADSANPVAIAVTAKVGGKWDARRRGRAFNVGYHSKARHYRG